MTETTKINDTCFFFYKIVLDRRQVNSWPWIKMIYFIHTPQCWLQIIERTFYYNILTLQEQIVCRVCSNLSSLFLSFPMKQSTIQSCNSSFLGGYFMLYLYLSLACWHFDNVLRFCLSLHQIHCNICCKLKQTQIYNM